MSPDGEAPAGKVLILIDSLASGGAERTVIMLSGYLARIHREVGVITLLGSENDFFETGTGVYRFPLEIPSRGNAWERILVNFRRLRLLRRLLKREKPDTLVGMMTGCAVLAILASIGMPVRVVVSERNNPGTKATRASWVWLRRTLYRLADAHVAQTRATAHWLEKTVAARNVYVVPNAVTWPLPQGKPVRRPEDMLLEGDRCILAVGTKIYQKGFDLLVDAFAKTGALMENWKLVILGVMNSDGGTESIKNLKDRARLAGVDEKVCVTGVVGNMSDWYARADIFALSSRYEGFPNVLLEAMASGRACVAFDCETGPGEIIQHESNGLLVPPGDATALAAGLKRLMNDEALRIKLSRNAMAIREKFSEDRVTAQWLRAIDGPDPATGRVGAIQ